jgi:hypothetical protein
MSALVSPSVAGRGSGNQSPRETMHADPEMLQ